VHQAQHLVSYSDVLVVTYLHIFICKACTWFCRHASSTVSALFYIIISMHRLTPLCIIVAELEQAQSRLQASVARVCWSDAAVAPPADESASRDEVEDGMQKLMAPQHWTNNAGLLITLSLHNFPQLSCRFSVLLHVSLIRGLEQIPRSITL
jgi:hypothetical protein